MPKKLYSIVFALLICIGVLSTTGLAENTTLALESEESENRVKCYWISTMLQTAKTALPSVQQLVNRIKSNEEYQQACSPVSPRINGESGGAIAGAKLVGQTGKRDFFEALGRIMWEGDPLTNRLPHLNAQEISERLRQTWFLKAKPPKKKY